MMIQTSANDFMMTFYKMGTLLISGASFILKDFHKVLLENGGMPLSLLETVVNDWTEQVKRSSTHSSSSQDRCLSGAMYTLTFLLLLNIWM